MKWYIFKCIDDEDWKGYPRGQWIACPPIDDWANEEWLGFDSWAAAIDHVYMRLFIKKLQTRVETPKAPVVREDWNAYP